MSESKDDVKAVMGLNAVSYSFPENFSLINRRTTKANYADQNSYSSGTGGEMQFRLQSSTDYVWGRNCYLRFDVLFSDASSADAKSQSFGLKNTPATAFFQRYLLEDKSGAELERFEVMNRWMRTVFPWYQSADYLQTTQMAGQYHFVGGDQAICASGPFTQTAASYALAVADATPAFTYSRLRVCIPLWWFSGVFDTETFIPSYLISGMIMRYTLEDASKTLSTIIGTAAGSATGTAYTITNAAVYLDSYELNPMAQRALMEQSQAGLEFSYCTRYHQQAEPGTATSYTLQVNKAVSRALAVEIMSENTAVTAGITTDNLGSTTFDYYSNQVRLGDIYLPLQPIYSGTSTADTDVQRNCSEFYANNLKSVGQFEHCDKPPMVSMDMMRSGTANGAQNDSWSCLIQSLEKSSVLEYDGLSVNNSRTLESRLEYEATNSVSRRIHAWLKYVKFLKVYPLQTVVSE